MPIAAGADWFGILASPGARLVGARCDGSVLRERVHLSLYRASASDRGSLAPDSARCCLTMSIPPVASRPALIPRWQLLLLFLVLIAGSTRLLVAAQRQGNLLEPYSPLLYQAATLGFNYFELGAVRRGLGGSIVHLLSRDILLATVYFHLLAAAAVAAGATLVFARLTAPLATRLAFVFVALAIMLRWAEDAGRTDMAVAALLAFATSRDDRNGARSWPARVSGSASSSTSRARSSAFRSWPRSRFGRDLPPSPAGSGTAARRSSRSRSLRTRPIALLPHASVGTMVDVVRSKFAPHVVVDWAIYFAVSGARGVQTSICQNLTDPSYWVHPLGGLVVLAVVAVGLSEDPARDWPAMAVAALPPFLFLVVVANDTSRWTNLASFNLWPMLAATRTPRRAPCRSTLASRLAAALSVSAAEPSTSRTRLTIRSTPAVR